MAAFKHGDVREDGYIFKGYAHGREQWASPAAFHRYKTCMALNGAKRRAAEKGLAFDLDLEYLLSVYPKDGMCPALRIPLVWLGGIGANSPSLDRIVPAQGYVKGNVMFISDRANRIKSDATTAEVCAVAEFLRKNDYR